MRMLGLDMKTLAFVFNDTQILQENMLEQICNLLNNGEIPNLFPFEEKIKLLEDLSNSINSGTPQEKFQIFTQRCRINLHVVICMSPVGETFRKRLRTFPALVNCTTIDWFLPWPEEALESTAQQFIYNQISIKLIQVEQAEEQTEEVKLQNVKSGLVKVCVDM